MKNLRMPDMVDGLTVLSQRTGWGRDTFKKMHAGISSPSRSLALALQDLTGVDCRKWLYPDRYGCPWEAWCESGFHLDPDFRPPKRKPQATGGSRQCH